MFGLKQKARGLASSLFNVVVFPKYEAYHWPEKQYARRLLRMLEIDCVFDVGANRGQFGQWLRHLGFDGSIISFEPLVGPFQELKALAAADGNWRCLPVALGREPGIKPLNQMASDVFSSFLSPTGDEAAGYISENTVESTCDAQIDTLDRIFASLQSELLFKHPLLKMDTQGFDLEVVTGAKRVLHNFSALLSEVAFKRLYQNAPSFAEAITAYESAGFDLAGMFPVHPYKTLKLIESNAYLVRRDLAGLDPL